MTIVGRMASLQVGKPTTYTVVAPPSDGQPVEWTSGIVKRPVSGSLFVGYNGVEGDGQADSVHHGGVDKAVLAYALSHYSRWQKEVGFIASGGGFGENFTVEGMDESSVCIGDVVAVGDAVLQVSQTRRPCWKISRHFGISDLLQKVQETGRTGWYFRVLQEGNVEAGQDLKLVTRPQPNWTIEHVNNITIRLRGGKADLSELATVPELATSARTIVQSLLLKERH